MPAARKYRLDALFAAIDRKDTDAFLGFLTPDADFRFGSAAGLHGHDAIRAGVDGFFTSIAGSAHAIDKVLADGNALACEGTVTYRRHNGTTITLPFTNVFEYSGDRICNYKIYIDIHPLYEEHGDA